MKYIIILLLLLIPLSLSATTVPDDEIGVSCPTDINIRDYARCKVEEKWGIEEYIAFEKILERESNWNYLAKNPRSSATGLCQTMMSLYSKDVDEDFITNPYKQIDWCIEYAQSRYGSPNEAWTFWIKNRWW